MYFMLTSSALAFPLFSTPLFLVNFLHSLDRTSFYPDCNYCLFGRIVTSSLSFILYCEMALVVQNIQLLSFVN